MRTDILGTIVPKSGFGLTPIGVKINNRSQGSAMPNDEPTIDKEQSSKVYRGFRCAYCHGKMKVETKCAWDESTDTVLKYRKCLQCGLTEKFTELRGNKTSN